MAVKNCWKTFREGSEQKGRWVSLAAAAEDVWGRVLPGLWDVESQDRDGRPLKCRGWHQ